MHESSQLNGLELTEEQKKTARVMLAESIFSARRYDGTEAAFINIIETLNRLDLWMRECFNGGEMLSDHSEALISISANARPHTINSIIEIASNNLRRILTSSESLDDFLSTLNVLREQINATLLPTKHAVPVNISQGKEQFIIELEPRVQRLIIALQKRQIFVDDIFITTGKNSPTMMRQCSYVLIEIPRIKREVLVCNQIGEATFISYIRRGINAYISRSKEELQSLEGVVRVVSPRNKSWENEIIDLLLRDISVEQTDKIDLRLVQLVRREILTQYPTASTWLSMQARERMAFKAMGYGEQKIASILGIQLAKSPCGYFYEHLLLGEIIYGADDADIKAAKIQEHEWADLEQNVSILIDKIKVRYPTSNEWMNMEKKESESFRVNGRSEITMAKALGLNLSPDAWSNIYGHACLGLVIYGKGDVRIDQIIENEENWRKVKENPELLIPEIKTICSTAEDWMSLSLKQKTAFSIFGHGEEAIGTVLGLDGKSPIGSKYEHARLGLIIYGKHQIITEFISQEENWQKLKDDPILLKEEILKHFPSPQGWMSLKAKRRFKIAGRGEDAIATAIGISYENRPCQNLYEHAQLGCFIYDVEIDQLLNLVK